MARHVLLVDDDAGIRMFLRLNFVLEGFEVTEAGDGVEGLEAVAAQRPDIVILDVMMPRLDGFGVLAALRRSEETRDIPVILLTARASEEDAAAGLEAGAVAYLTKPFDPTELVELAIRSALPARAS
jgi:DNA-binding response OmpR family regulator